MVDGPTPTVTFSYPSVYEVELTVSDEIWQSDQDTVVIAVSDWMTVEGRILNEFHSPRADQCVWVYDAEIRNRPELWRDLINGNVGTWGFAYSDSHGEFTIGLGRVALMEYVLYVNDCNQYRYEWEWFDNRDSIGEADVITGVGGEQIDVGDILLRADSRDSGNRERPVRLPALGGQGENVRSVWLQALLVRHDFVRWHLHTARPAWWRCHSSSVLGS